MRQNPKPQEIYRHFKGNIYQIITIARHSENGMKMVVYQQLYAPYEVYVRPLEMFMSRIDTRKYPNEKQKYRFEKLDINGEEQTEVIKTEPPVSEPVPVKSEPIKQENEFELDPGLMEFLDADTESANSAFGFMDSFSDFKPESCIFCSSMVRFARRSARAITFSGLFQSRSSWRKYCRASFPFSFRWSIQISFAMSMVRIASSTFRFTIRPPSF